MICVLTTSSKAATWAAANDVTNLLYPEVVIFTSILYTRCKNYQTVFYT